MSEQAEAEIQEEDVDLAWLCACGNYQEDGFHCKCCGNEPPWGCDCSMHDDDYIEEDEYYPSDYPFDHPRNCPKLAALDRISMDRGPDSLLE